MGAFPYEERRQAKHKNALEEASKQTRLHTLDERMRKKQDCIKSLMFGYLAHF